MFLALFLIGLLGFVLMTVMGFVHTGGHISHSNAGHGAVGHGAGHGIGGHSVLGHTPSAHLGHHVATPATHGHAKSGGFKGERAANIFLLLSPVTFFSLLMGAGATGLLLQKLLIGTPLLLAAAFGALVFGFGVVRPLMNVLANFASRPSEGLEGMVAQTAIASTRFDREGHGLVTLKLDGQLVQILATLEADEIERGVEVGKGDSVVIVEVDKMRNTCRVTRELAA